MNVSHAAAIVFYELFSNKQKQVIEASGKEKEVLFDYFGEIVNSLAVIRDKKKVIKIFKNIVNRSMIAGKEAHALAGALGEIRKKI
jgi:tRNA C32,U32 (ribose-2'-O)-methylase TrmJ